MKTYYRMLLSLAFLLSFLAASSQVKEWSLEDCINYALDSNINVKQQVLLVESQKAQLLQSYLIMLPDLNAGATHGYNWGQTVDRYTNQFATKRVQSNNFYLGTQFNLFQGLRQINTVSQTKLDYQAIQYDLDKMMDDISIAVAGYYLDILYGEELLEVARAQYDITQQQVNRMEKMVEAGTLARGDLLNLEAQLATEELQIVEAENRLMISSLSLQQLIDKPYDRNFKIETPDLKPIEAPQVVLTPENVYQVALDQRPEIKSAELRLESAKKGVSIARGYLSPTLSFSGSWATGYSGAAETAKRSLDRGACLAAGSGQCGYRAAHAGCRGGIQPALAGERPRPVPAGGCARQHGPGILDTGCQHVIYRIRLLGARACVPSVWDIGAWAGGLPQGVLPAAVHPAPRQRAGGIDFRPAPCLRCSGAAADAWAGDFAEPGCGGRRDAVCDAGSDGYKLADTILLSPKISQSSPACAHTPCGSGGCVRFKRQHGSGSQPIALDRYGSKCAITVPWDWLTGYPGIESIRRL